MWSAKKDRFNYKDLELLVIREAANGSEVDILLTNGDTDDLLKLLLMHEDVHVYANRRASSHLKFRFLNDPKGIEYDVVSELRYGQNGSGSYRITCEDWCDSDIVRIGRVLHILFDKKKVDISALCVDDFRFLNRKLERLPLLLRFIFDFKRFKVRRGYLGLLRLLGMLRLSSILSSIKRRFFSDHRAVIFMGVDGSGKSTLADGLLRSTPNTKYIYNGRYGGFSVVARFLSNMKNSRRDKSRRDKKGTLNSNPTRGKVFNSVVQSLLNVIRIVDSTFGFNAYRLQSIFKREYLIIDRSIYESPSLARFAPFCLSLRPHVIIHVKAGLDLLLSRKAEHSGAELERMMMNHVVSLSRLRWSGVISISTNKSPEVSLNKLKTELSHYDKLWQK